MKQRILAAALVVSTMLCLAAPASAMQLKDTVGTDEEYVISSSDSKVRSTVSISDVDELMKEYSNAVVSEDMDAVTRLDQELYEMGVRDVSFSDIIQMTGDADTPMTLAASDNITFKTAYSEIIVNGETKEIMRIYATPTKGCEMYHRGTAEGSTVVVNTAANALHVCKVWGLWALGNVKKYGPVISFFAAFYDSISGLEKDTNVHSMDANYIYTCAENTVFLYFKNSIGTWTHIGTSNYLAYAVTYVLDSYVIDGVITRPSQISHDYSGNLSVSGYNDASAIYKQWLSGGPYTSLQFRTFDIGQAANVNVSIVTLNLLCPLLPGNCA